MPLFLHTADWQLGKPFGRVADDDKRALLRNERLEVIGRIGEAARRSGAEFVLVAGDLFDSATPDEFTVSRACAEIGKIGLPVIAIPGNHDFGGPGGVWGRDWFRREQEVLAPNFRVLLDPTPVEVGGAVVLPCPLRRRHERDDPTAWLRDPAAWEGLPPDRPRIVFAHGSVQGFSSTEDGHAPANHLDLSRLPSAHWDYCALGDWHAMSEVRPGAWYPGAPEPDRFPRGENDRTGHVLAVRLPGRGMPPEITPRATGRLRWHQEAFTLASDDAADRLAARLDDLLGGRAGEDLLRLTLSGAAGLAAARQLDELRARLDARLLHLRWRDEALRILPSDDETTALEQRAAIDPLLAAVAARLRADLLRHEAAGEADEAELTRLALRELYAAAMTPATA